MDVDDPQDTIETPDGTDLDWDTTPTSLFEGDRGTLDIEQRRCLVRLLKQPVVTESDERAWRTLVTHEDLLRSRLNDLLLDLHVDQERGVALATQVRHPTNGEFPPLFPRSTYKREETILLVYLRAHRHAERAKGHDKVFVDVEDCQREVENYRPADATDVSGDRRRVTTAIDELAGMRVLAKASEGRYEITPVIEVLLSLENLKALHCELRTLNDPHATPAPQDTNDPQEQA